MLIFIFTLFGSLIMLAQESDGSSVSVFNVSDELTSSYVINGAHTKDDYTVIPYQDEDNNLMLAYRRPVEESWSNVEIAPFDYLSNTGGWKVEGAVVTSNNSVVVYCYFAPDGQYQPVLFISYGDQNFNDPWTYFVVSASDKYPTGMAINDTDHIALITRSPGALYAGIYDFENNVMEYNLANWYSATNAFGSITCNKTGVFHIAYGSGASVTSGYTRDYFKLNGAIAFTSGYQRYNCYIACLDNDRLVVSWTYTFGAGGALYISIQAAHEGGYWQRLLKSGVFTSTNNGVVSVKQNSSTFAVSYYIYNDDNYYKYEAAFDADQSTWQASETILFNDADTNSPMGSFNQIWPRHNDTSFSQPVSGWVFVVWDDNPAPQDTFFIIHEGLSWTGDMFFVPPPMITTPSLPDGAVGISYSFTMSATGGELPYSWALITAPAWLDINPSTGKLTGIPLSPGDYYVRIRVTDDNLNTDEELFTLTVTGEAAPAPGRKMDFPFSIDTLMAAMWWIFIVLAMFIAVMDVIVKVRNKASRRFQ